MRCRGHPWLGLGWFWIGVIGSNREERRSTRFLDRTKRNGSNGALDSGEVPYPAQQCPERCRRVGTNFEQIAVFTRRVMTFEDIRLLMDEFFECLLGSAGRVIGYSNK